MRPMSISPFEVKAKTRFLELLAALRGTRKFGGIRGLSYKDDFGLRVHNAERPMRSPDDFPWPPYHRLANPEKYILPTFLGRRTAVHHASIGCPFRCKFCGVVPVHEGRQKMEGPERTAAILTHLQREYNIDSVQFYDNNFFLSESHAREQAERLTPLGLRWWAEGRVDAMHRYSDQTMRALRRSGATMIFFGAESGSDKVLAEMNKRITSSQTLELAARIRSSISSRNSLLYLEIRRIRRATRATLFNSSAVSRS
jgi:anaerobic magnesium-protoporphyrin IX monomethyl ester cyclase